VTIEVDPRVLSCVPHRLAEWRVGDDGIVVVERARPDTRGLRGLLDRVRWFMSVPRIRLDAIGSAFWQRMDGSTPLEEIVGAVADEFPDRSEEMTDRAALFVTALQRQELLELRMSG
jgi:hypothetical protein